MIRRALVTCFVLGAGAASAPWACGGATGDDAFASGDASTSGTDGTAETGVDPDANASNGDVVTTTPRDGGPFTDAAPSLTADGGAANDAGPGGNTSSVACGSASCSLATAFCCVYRNANPPPAYTFACASGSGCPTLGGTQDRPTALACSSAANCPSGSVCCVRQQNDTTWSECAATCTGGNGAQLCDPTLADAGTGECPAQAPCSSNNIGEWGLPHGFATCGGRGN